MTQPVVHIIDDDPAVVQAISIVAKSLGYSVSTFNAAEAFLYGYEENTHGCLLLDIKMPGMGGMQLQRMLADAKVELPIIMMSGHADISMVVELMERGALTFLEKPFRMEKLREQISRAIEVDAKRREIKAEENEYKARLSRLTHKEMEVLQLIRQGRTNREMAEQLSLTVRAIEDRRARLMRKLEAKSIPEMITISQYVDV